MDSIRFFHNNCNSFISLCGKRAVIRWNCIVQIVSTHWCECGSSIKSNILRTTNWWWANKDQARSMTYASWKIKLMDELIKVVVRLGLCVSIACWVNDANGLLLNYFHSISGWIISNAFYQAHAGLIVNRTLHVCGINRNRFRCTVRLKIL